MFGWTITYNYDGMCHGVAHMCHAIGCCPSQASGSNHLSDWKEVGGSRRKNQGQHKEGKKIEGDAAGRYRTRRGGAKGVVAKQMSSTVLLTSAILLKQSGIASMSVDHVWIQAGSWHHSDLQQQVGAAD